MLAAAVNVTVPFPDPLAPDAIDSHGTSLAAVHAHPAAAVTAMGAPAPPVAARDCVVGAIEAAQPAA